MNDWTEYIKDKKNVILNIRITEEDKKKLQRIADRQEETISSIAYAFIKCEMEECIRKINEMEAKKFKELVKEIEKKRKNNEQ